MFISKKLLASACALALLAALLLPFSIAASAQEGLLAFPGADGVGKYTSGGRGGDVYVVTSLEDERVPGTLRYACEA